MGRTDVERAARRATNHEARRAIVLHLLRTSIAWSPRELAEELDMKLGDVSYHVRMLRDDRVLVLKKTEQVRGAIKHYYALAPQSTAVGRRVRELMGEQGSKREEALARALRDLLDDVALERVADEGLLARARAALGQA